MSKFSVGLNDTPVFRDGATTDLTYVFVACKVSDTYNGVVYGRTNIKFYPNAQFWGITDSIASAITGKSLYSRSTYEGIHSISVSQAEEILDRIRTQRGSVVIGKGVLAKFNPSTFQERQSSRKLHPSTSGVPSVNSLPEFKGPRVSA